MDSMIGSTVSAKRSASLGETARPLAEATAGFVGLPSLVPLDLREARAALVRLQRSLFGADVGPG